VTEEQPSAPPRPWFDHTDLHTGPLFSDAILGLLPLVGVWHGRGVSLKHGWGAIGDAAEGGDVETVAIGHQIVFAHNGADHLSYTSYQWEIGADGGWVADQSRESGFWSLGPETTTQNFIGPVEELYVSLTTPQGQAETFDGHAGDLVWLFASNEAISIDATLLAGGEQRLYRITENELQVGIMFAGPDGTLVPKLNTKLSRRYSPLDTAAE
jgi:hypothetical protein